MSKTFLLDGAGHRLKFCFSAAIAGASVFLMLTPGCLAQAAVDASGPISEFCRTHPEAGR